MVNFSPIYRDSCNIADDTYRPVVDGMYHFIKFMHLATCSSSLNSLTVCLPVIVNDMSQANLFGSDILPFVDRVRPDMTRPRTVAGIYKKNASACWTVMKSKSKLAKEVEQKHERPWATSSMQSRTVAIKPVTDSQGTMTLETFMKIKDQITKHDSASMKNTGMYCVNCNVDKMETPNIILMCSDVL